MTDNTTHKGAFGTHNQVRGVYGTVRLITHRVWEIMGAMRRAVLYRLKLRRYDRPASVVRTTPTLRWCAIDWSKAPVVDVEPTARPAHTLRWRPEGPFRRVQDGVELIE